MTDQYSVLIVGAGPSGLTLANDLARRGVPFKIIDKKAGPTTDSKGLALNVSSLYGFRLLGMEDKIGCTGMPVSRLNVYWNDRRFATMNFDRLPHDIHTLVTQPQAETEQELIFQLGKYDIFVEWNTALNEIHESTEHVEVTIESALGKRQEIFQYVVGCDGKNSRVRSYLNTSFTGNDYEMYFSLGDFDVDLPYSDQQVQYFVYEDTFFIFVPIATGRWRFVVKYDGKIPDTPVSKTEIEQVLKRHFGEDFVLGKPNWISRAPFYNRIAGRLQKNRLFIAGDAAHLFSPIGGTGMNTGIQDVLNLGWRLAFVHHGTSEVGLLNGYEAERLPAIQEAANISDLSTQLISRNFVEHPILDSMSPVFNNRNKFRYIFPKVHSGLAQKLLLSNQVEQFSSDNSRVGEFSDELFFLSGKVDFIRRYRQPENRLWCLVREDALQENNGRCEDWLEIRESLQRLHLVDIILVNYGEEIDGPISSDASGILSVTIPKRLEPSISNRMELTLVRPDGVVAFEINIGTDCRIDEVVALQFHLHMHQIENRKVTKNEAIF
jgi:2-polyprenyl-6-methoxyphenol hydroxylase-like FAD-dependent oxidoreductase